MKKEISGAVQGNFVDLYALDNVHGLEVRAMNYGGIIVSVRAGGRYARRWASHDAVCFPAVRIRCAESASG
jgi:galactose mutarotase-like enzyme